MIDYIPTASTRHPLTLVHGLGRAAHGGDTREATPNAPTSDGYARSAELEEEGGSGRRGSVTPLANLLRQEAAPASKTSTVRPAATNGGAKVWQSSLANAQPLGGDHIKSYGKSLMRNKNALLQGLKEAGANPALTNVVMGVAMQETNEMRVGQRDSSKDNKTDGSKNYSPLNINEDMIRRIYGDKADGVLSVMNGNDDAASLKAAARFFKDATQRWGIDKTLVFLRSGSGAFNNYNPDEGYKPGYLESDKTTREYFDHVARIVKNLQNDPKLLRDGRRVEIDTTHK